MWVAPDGSLTWNGTEFDGDPTHWKFPDPPTEDQTILDAG